MGITPLDTVCVIMCCPKAHFIKLQITMTKLELSVSVMHLVEVKLSVKQISVVSLRKDN